MGGGIKMKEKIKYTSDMPKSKEALCWLAEQIKNRTRR